MKTYHKQDGFIDMDELAKLFKLPTSEEVIEYNIDYICECATGATEEECMKAEEEAQDELAHKWYDAVLRVATHLFEEHGMGLSPRRKNEKRPWEFKVVSDDWFNAAGKVIDTINGVGYFYYNSVGEFVRVGPYCSPRQAVLNHLHWMKDRPEVYGDTRPARMYENYWK